MYFLKKIVITGASGFAGCNLTEHLISKGYKVYAILRPYSAHNLRLVDEKGNSFYHNLVPVYLDISDISRLPNLIDEDCDVFFHLAWPGSRDAVEQQLNVEYTEKALTAAADLSCRRFICTGSQAEYGQQGNFSETDENTETKPITEYGKAKVMACDSSKQLAAKLGIDWNWIRIFSLYGKYEPNGRMLPDLISSLKEGKTMKLSSCTQMWDFLDAGDAAEGMISVMERGKSGEIYNLANGDYHPLKYFTEIVKKKFGNGDDSLIEYGDDAIPFISLRPDVRKIKRDTDWKPIVRFEDDLENETLY